MNDDADKIYVDASQPATLRHASGPVNCRTTEEAVIAWHRLPAADREQATIRVAGGTVYTANEIDRLHYGPKPK